MFTQEWRSSARDCNVIREEVPYFGCIQLIWELSYGDFDEIIFYCDWHRSNLSGQRATLVKDETTFWRVKSDHFLPASRPMDEPFVYPRQVTQCTFIDAPAFPGWSYAIPYVPRSRVVIDEAMDDIPRALQVNDYFS